MIWLSKVHGQKSADTGPCCSLLPALLLGLVITWESWHHCHSQPEITCAEYLTHSLSWNVNPLISLTSGCAGQSAPGQKWETVCFSLQREFWILNPARVKKWVITSRFVWILYISQRDRVWFPHLFTLMQGKHFNSPNAPSCGFLVLILKHLCLLGDYNSMPGNRLIQRKRYFV